MLSKGLWLCLLTVFFDALYDVACRIVAVNFSISPLVFVAVSVIASAFVLFVVSSSGKGGLSTIRQPHTWIFSLIAVIMSLTFIYILSLVTTTEATLLARFNVFMGVIVLWAFMSKKQEWYDVVAGIAAVVGCGIIAWGLDESVRTLAIILSIFYSLLLVLRAVVMENHPASIEASSIKERCRVTAFVLLCMGIFFLLLALGAAAAGQDASMKLGPYLTILPTYADFVDRDTIFSAVIVGAFTYAPATYFFFHATVTAKTQTFLAVAALMPVAAFGIESIFAHFDVLDLTSLSLTDMAAGVVIIAGALLSVFMREREKRSVADRRAEPAE